VERAVTDQAEGKLREVVRVALELPADADVTRAEQSGVESWDSLAHVSLMLALESEFAISIDVADQMRLTSYPAIRTFLKQRGALP
jgi:acyl carrier protein